MLVGDAREGICFRMRWVESVMCRALHSFSIMAPTSSAEHPRSLATASGTPSNPGITRCRHGHVERLERPLGQRWPGCATATRRGPRGRAGRLAGA